MSCVTIILGLVALDFSNAFSLKKSEPETPLVVKEAESFPEKCSYDHDQKPPWVCFGNWS